LPHFDCAPLHLADASNLVRVNQEALAACSEAAAKAKKEQRCTITVPAL